MQYRILGPLEVLDDGQPVALGGTKQKALLAVLLLHANQVVSVDRLVEDLWGEEAPATAENVIQTYVSRLRKALEGTDRRGVLVSRRPGYILHVSPGELDLRRFEELVERGRDARQRGDPASAAGLLRDALGMWSGEPLADFAFETFAQRDIERLQEVRLATVEERIQADLDAGLGAELVAELGSLVRDHPLRERVRGQLMVALYRAGRQADALETFQEARRVLADEMGIDPGPELQRLERAILTHDASLGPLPIPPDEAPVEAEPEDVPWADRSILIVPRDPANLDDLLTLAEPLSQSKPARDLLVVQLIGSWSPKLATPAGAQLVRATETLNAVQKDLLRRGIASRVVAFTSEGPDADVGRLTDDYSVDLVMMDGRPEDLQASGSLGAAIEAAGCDVAILVTESRHLDVGTDRPVMVPFGGTDHDWAAVLFGAVVAQAYRSPLHLVGSAADLGSGRRDASRLLGTASLMVQQAVRVVAEPVLVEPGEGVAEAMASAGLVVLGLSERWSSEGLGALRERIVRTVPAPVVGLRRGPRSATSGRRDALTTFSWSRVPRPQPRSRRRSQD